MELGEPFSKEGFKQLGGPCHTDWGWGYVPILLVAHAAITDHFQVRVQTPCFRPHVSSRLGLFFQLVAIRPISLSHHFIWPSLRPCQPALY